MHRRAFLKLITAFFFGGNIIKNLSSPPSNKWTSITPDQVDAGNPLINHNHRPDVFIGIAGEQLRAGDAVTISNKGVLVRARKGNE